MKMSSRILQELIAPHTMRPCWEKFGVSTIGLLPLSTQVLMWESFPTRLYLFSSVKITRSHWVCGQITWDLANSSFFSLFIHYLAKFAKLNFLRQLSQKIKGIFMNNLVL